MIWDSNNSVCPDIPFLGQFKSGRAYLLLFPKAQVSYPGYHVPLVKIQDLLQEERYTLPAPHPQTQGKTKAKDTYLNNKLRPKRVNMTAM